MTTQINQGPEVKIERGRAEITVPHRDKRITFIHPPKGPNFYEEVMKQIIDEGLKIPTGEHIVSLLYATCRDLKMVGGNLERLRGTVPIDSEPNYYLRKVIKVAGDGMVSNRNLWIPEDQQNAGVFVVYDERGVGVSEPLDQGELEKVLENGKDLIINGTKIRVSNDRKVRFASRDTYEGGEQNYGDFARNGFVIASYLESVDQLVEFSKAHVYIPEVSIRNPETPAQTFSALSGGHSRLQVDGNSPDCIHRAYGMLETPA